MTEHVALRVVSGSATPEEIAAVLAAVASAGAPAAAPSEEPVSIWSAPGHGHRNIRATFTPSPHGWRTSFWPR